MKFAIDLDGVLCNFDAEVCRRINKIWPNRLPPNYTPRDWNYQEVLKPEEWDKIWQGILNTQDFFTCLSPLPGAFELQQFLIKHPLTECYFVTSRHITKGASPYIQSCYWLYKLDLWPRDINSEVIVVSSPADKRQAILENEIPFFLDDYAPTIADLQSAAGVKSFLLNAPYNEYAVNLPRVHSVTEYLNIVEKHFELK